MNKKLFKNSHDNTPGHAHELTFSVYRRQNVFLDDRACEMFIYELAIAREEFAFRIWAYMVMPNHVHPLIWPLEPTYSIESINKAIKGRMAKRYIKFDKDNGRIGCLQGYSVIEKGVERFRIWQTGGGFDRNVWNGNAIHHSIEYIEANPVRRKLSPSPETYRWSSAYSRRNSVGIIPDRFDMPVAMPNAQEQWIGAV